ncbi:SDR family oxidoreductase [Pontibacillus yanchengensis]|uniref:Thioester reductase (TE) domain-containing protein n=1 Tax=Pontibacillus yanchengensis Y32 TaxID=1385514 RepID=A0A0A2TRN0_9BACI|nr:SDR family oxidoreductase [Pontibacillus yanchengensis]KGP71900.1 hypothetical protein N782_15905 [Pontibacillus yanchengensis Y32]
MKNVYFFTGFPGFLTSYLIEELLEQQDSIEKIYLLILPSTKTESEKKIETISRKCNVSQNLFELVNGDITKKNIHLDASTSDKILSTLTHAYHLAALYDLSVPLKPAYQVNVQGTQFLNEWLRGAKRLQHYTYFSTAYVSGKRTGDIYEHELDHEFGFKNYYEATKYQAERLVQEQKEHLPVTIIRPGIVVGNSQTGETAKFDGPYFLLHLFDRLKFLPTIPYFGNANTEANFVPVDYITKATIYLSHQQSAIGQTYHLTDPHPYKTREVYKMLMEALLGQSPQYTLPINAAYASLTIMPVRKWLNIQKQTLPYFTHDCHYDTTAAYQQLQKSNITCPNFETVIPSIIKYYRTHKDDETKRIKIV